MPLKKSTKASVGAPPLQQAPLIEEKAERVEKAKKAIAADAVRVEKQRLSFNLPTSLHQKMRQHYADTGLPMSALVEKAVEAYLKAH